MMQFCFQVHSDEYSFLVYDSFERNMKGNEQPHVSEIKQIHVYKAFIRKAISRNTIIPLKLILICLRCFVTVYSAGPLMHHFYYPISVDD